MDSAKNINFSLKTFPVVIAGAFFQLSKKCIAHLSEIIRHYPKPQLILDVSPDHTEASIQRFEALSEYERNQFFSQMGMKNILRMKYSKFRLLRSDTSSNYISKMQVGKDLFLLCGIIESGITSVLARYFESLQGDISIENWNEYLGYLYPLSGLVVKGNQLGHTIGYPTANLDLGDKTKISPPLGVYAGWAKVGEKWYKAMMNIGFRPTLNLQTTTIEAHLIDFTGNLYGQRISLHLAGKIRNEIRFPSLQHLKHQLDHDKINTLHILDRLNIAPKDRDFLLFTY